MQSKTSLFNGTVFKKNLTRFAPAWGLYTLCLILGMLMLYADNGQIFWFAHRMGTLIQGMSMINLVYGAVTAMLLFGDLYNGRMCNALHAMPLRREGLFVTNVLSGLTFSLLPTAIGTILALPMLMGTRVVDAWQIGLLWFAAANLSFVCFFGLAVFCVFCAGSRFAMALVYAPLNIGAYLVYVLIDTVYTPMLYGVVTSHILAERLTPVLCLVNSDYIKVENYLDLVDRNEGHAENIVAHFTLAGGWSNLLVWAAIGVLFLLVGLALYRRRNLECAGDALALRGLEPVFAVMISVFGAALFYIVPSSLYGQHSLEALKYMLMAGGLAVGWFAAWMMIARSARVFQIKKWIGLLGLAAVLAASLVLNHMDTFGVERWIPDPEKVQSVTLSTANTYNSIQLTRKEDIRQMIRLQELALEDRIPSSGSFPVSAIQQGVEGVTIAEPDRVDFTTLTAEEYNQVPRRRAVHFNLAFQMDNGRTIQRKYYAWTDEEEGDILREYLSRWEVVRNQMVFGESLPPASDFTELNIYDYNNTVSLSLTPELSQSLLEAVQADCASRRMTQSDYFHDGYFRDSEGNIRESFYIELEGRERTFARVEFFADSEHTLSWLRQHDLLPWEVHPENPWETSAE